MADGFEVSSKKVKWLTFHLVISYKFLYPFPSPCELFGLVIIVLFPRAKVSPSCNYAVNEVKLNFREGELQVFLAQSKEVSFAVLSASYLPTGVSQAFSVHMNQLRLEKGTKSKAQPSLIVFATLSSDYPVQCKTDHKTGSEAISLHLRTQGRFGTHLPPALKAFLEEWLITPLLNEGWDNGAVSCFIRNVPKLKASCAIPCWKTLAITRNAFFH